jgi:hypothetical protein
LDGRRPEQHVELTPLQHSRARVIASDPDSDPYRYRWALRAESTATQVGGDPETLPPLIPDAIDGGDSDEIVLKAPREPGAYRLFVTVDDQCGHAAHANIPFRVRRMDR